MYVAASMMRGECQDARRQAEVAKVGHVAGERVGNEARERTMPPTRELQAERASGADQPGLGNDWLTIRAGSAQRVAHSISAFAALRTDPADSRHHTGAQQQQNRPLSSTIVPGNFPIMNS